ncbi:MAG TPA: cobyrinic acid a,c-diamide synthase, partial [Nitrospirota bacterium]
GVFYPMAGVFPAKTRMLDRRKALGYREVTVTGNDIIFPAGKKARGHEFHYSEISTMPAKVKTAYSVTKAGDSRELKEGYIYRNVLASYVHLHFLSNRGFARAFAEKVKKVQAPYKRA